MSLITAMSEVEKRFKRWYKRGDECTEGFEKAMKFYFRIPEKYKRVIEKSKLFAQVLEETYNFQFGKGITGVVASAEIFENLDEKIDLTKFDWFKEDLKV